MLLTDAGLVFGLFVFFVCLILGLEYLREKFPKSRRPVICVCKVQGRVGVVLREDYDSASRKYWKPYYDGEEDYDAGHITAPCGQRLELAPVFVFEPQSREYYTLCYSCYVEQATFEVPFVAKEDLNPIGEAWKYFHKCAWPGHLIHW